MENFCAYRERCPKEVKAKLIELGAKKQDFEQIYEVLQKDNFFNEQRFALAFAGGKFRINHWGKVRIKMELQKREISATFIQEALHSIDEKEYRALIRDLLKKKLVHLNGDPFTIGQKAMASMSRAGFEHNHLITALKEILANKAP
jgi:regulatory protein